MGDPGEAEQALADGDWVRAKVLWHALACATPQDRHYRAQLTYARAGELFAAGDARRAVVELERVLRIEPTHSGAKAMLEVARPSMLGRLFGR